MAERRRGLSLGTRIFLVTGLLLVLALGVAIIVTSYLGNRIGLATATERFRSSRCRRQAFRTWGPATISPATTALA